MTTAGCTSFQGLYAQRFFLGFLEAGISPIFMLVVGGWYEKCELVKPLLDDVSLIRGIQSRASASNGRML